MSPMTVVADLEDFVTTYRSHGELMPEVGQPTPNGYMLEVACSCGVVFMRWVTREDAAPELALEGLRERN
jgi:hypothetical protein